MFKKPFPANRQETVKEGVGDSCSNDYLVSPLTATMSKLSTSTSGAEAIKKPMKSQQTIFRLNRQRSKSLTLAVSAEQNRPHPHDTPLKSSTSSGLVKPSPSAFHSTGILSKKGRGLLNDQKITPETPVKHKRVLGSIWSGADGPTNAPLMLKSMKSNQQSASSSNRGMLNQDTPLLKRSASFLPSTSIHHNTPQVPGLSHAVTSKPPQIPNFVSPFDFGISQTPSVTTASSIKSNRLHRSPLKETPTKIHKRPHLEPEDYLQLQQHQPLQEIALAAVENNNSNSGMDIAMEESSPIQTKEMSVDNSCAGSESIFKESRSLVSLDSPQGKAKSGDGDMENLQPMQPPSTVEMEGTEDVLVSQPSPVVPAKLFFSRIVKERKHAPIAPSITTIPFSALISRYRHPIDKLFFEAVDGVQPGLSQTLELLSRRASDDDVASINVPDWFESRFELVGRLGQGAFADAFYVQSLDDGLEYAIKKTKHPFIGYKDAMKKLKEVRMLLKMKVNPYCISLKDAWIQFGYIYIQTEICKRGSLAAYFEQHCSEVPLTEDQIWRILSDLIQGISYIHQQGVVHLDIKPANVFISQNGTLKIGDFGLASRPPVVSSESEGDRTYLAPELLTSSTASFPVDIFSLGLISLEMAANIILPQNGVDWQQLREGNIEGIGLQRHSMMLSDFIRSMLCAEPDLRPTAIDLLKHPKIASFIH